MVHPQVVVAFTLLRRDGTQHDHETDILSFAALRVTRRTSTEAAFELVHRAYNRPANARGALAEMRALIPRGSLVIGEAPPDDGPRENDAALLRSCESGLIEGLPMLGAEDPPHASSMVLRGFDTRMEGIAEAFDVPLIGPGALLVEHARGLADRVQALWLTWLCVYCPPREARTIAASFDAWRHLEAARPLAF